MYNSIQQNVQKERIGEQSKHDRYMNKGEQARRVPCSMARLFLGSRSHVYLYWPGNESSMTEAEVMQLSRENILRFPAISLASLNFERQCTTEISCKRSQADSV